MLTTVMLARMIVTLAVAGMVQIKMMVMTTV